MTRVLATLNWPADYLAAADPMLSRLVQDVAKRLARGKDFAVIAGKLGLGERYLRHHYREGCELIAAGLRALRCRYSDDLRGTAPAPASPTEAARLTRKMPVKHASRDANRQSGGWFQELEIGLLVNRLLPYR